MRTGMSHDYPARLERLRLRFDRWRRTCDGRSRIPEALWASAVKAVGRCGLNPTARALRLDYYSLKKRVDAGDSREGSGRREAAESAAGKIRRSQFIELAPVASASPECILEFEHPGGAKMRVRLTGTQVPDLTALSRSFWGLEA
jgi:hypothetical protein